jgi:hypothetical protein
MASLMEARRVSEGAAEWVVYSRFSLANAAGFHVWLFLLLNEKSPLPECPGRASI